MARIGILTTIKYIFFLFHRGHEKKNRKLKRRNAKIEFWDFDPKRTISLHFPYQMED